MPHAYAVILGEWPDAVNVLVYSHLTSAPPQEPVLVENVPSGSKIEREILRKAAQYFAKEMGR